MPKEYVYGEASPIPEMGDQPCENETPVVVVGWSRESGHVQIASRLRECEIFFDSEHPDAPIPVTYGFYVTLSRGAINDLIRTLRKARDQAFGRDE